MTRGRKELNKVVDVIITKRGIQLPAKRRQGNNGQARVKSRQDWSMRLCLWGLYNQLKIKDIKGKGSKR